MELQGITCPICGSNGLINAEETGIIELHCGHKIYTEKIKEIQIIANIKENECSLTTKELKKLAEKNNKEYEEILKKRIKINRELARREE